ncbi:hypothetical protein AMAG_13593 [Allomyces macrogynus ATCC 38327]|uniref:Tyrosinase copper-binding domain-containing protein n=1 Tax=Allomyces macrogynus (strain ATCC 38327) TaxID=578462 RepID=A0A0L0T3A5_ALLM3|nr:hypothetical protein AMAG_13593 [Allomyces macrogynus ATCC 38327]|eukprot:KNE69201.1 hypothetical protein AMAG_13593 [Allomyces macrogynus ATCC 38327]
MAHHHSTRRAPTAAPVAARRGALAQLSSLAFLAQLGILTVMALAASNLAYATCSSRRIRKEIYDLSAAQAASLVGGLKTLYNNGVAKRFTDMHVSMNSDAHNTPQFTPFHRAMIWQFETELLKVAPELTGLPYWDATYQADDPGSSFIFRNDMFGAAVSGCLTGSFDGIPNTASGLPGCVRRDPRPNFTLFSSTLLANALTSESSYSSFESTLEYGEHASVHNYVSGNMGNVMYSPSDPIFWAHHCAVDYYWSRWQGLNNGANANKYNGQHKNRAVSTRDVIMNQTVGDILDYANTLCYEYQPPQNAPAGKEPFPVGGSSDNSPGKKVSDSLETVSADGPPRSPRSRTVSAPSPLTPDFVTEFGVDRDGVDRVHQRAAATAKLLQDQIASGIEVPSMEDLARLAMPDGPLVQTKNENPQKSSAACAAGVQLVGAVMTLLVALALSLSAF